MYNQSVVIGNTPQDIKWRLSEKKGYKGRYLAKKRGARGGKCYVSGFKSTQQSALLTKYWYDQ
jgi:hypothetical protein